MADILKPDRFSPRRLSKDEMIRHFLEESIKTMEFQLARAHANRDQNAIAILFGMIAKSRHILQKVLTDPVAS